MSNLSLRLRLSLLATVGFVLVFAIMAWLGSRALDAVTQTIMQERLSLASAVALHLDQELERTFNRLTQVAASPAINFTDGNLEPEKAELRALYHPEDFGYVFLLDNDGLVLWTEPYLPVVGIHHPECPHIQQALRTGQPAIACVTHTLTPLNPVVEPVVPIHDKEGNVVGILGAAIDPNSPAFTHMLVKMAQGTSAYVQLVDENGVTLTHTADRNLFQRSEHADLFISLLRESRADITTTMVSEAGKGTFREVIVFAPLSRAPWGIAVEQEEADLLATVVATRRKMEVFAVLALASALLLVWVVTGSIVAPVRRLVTAAQRITSGDLETPVPQQGKDEIGELARNFEAMREHLASWGEELETAVQQRTREISVLYLIDRATSQSLNLEVNLPNAVEAVLSALQIETGGIYLLEPDGKTLTLRTSRGLSDEFVENVRHIQLGEGISGRAAAERKPVVLDVEDYPPERLAPFIVEAGFQTLASTPLLSAGEVVGALSLGTLRRRAFPPEALELLASIGQQLGAAVYNARLYQEIQERAGRLSLLNHVARALSTTLNLNDLLEAVYREITSVIEADAFFIALYDRVAGELDFRVQVDKGVRVPPVRCPLAPGLTSLVVTSRQPLLIRDFEAERDRLPPAGLWGSMEAPRSWLGVPLLLGEDVVGVISVQAYRSYAYDEAEQELLSTIADAVAVAVENARLYAAEQRRAARLSDLLKLGIELTTLCDEKVVLDTLVSRAATLAESPACTVMLVDEKTDEAVLAAQVGLPEGTPSGLRVPLALPIIRRSLETGQPIILQDVDRDAPEMRAILVRKDVRAFFAYPMIWEGRTVGYITLSSLTPRAPSTEEITAYQLLAERAAVALENVRLYEAEIRRAGEMAALVEVIQTITGSISLTETLDRILDSARKIVSVSECSITLVDEPSGDLVVRASTNGETGLRLSPAASSAVGWVVKTKEILVEEDVPANPIFDQQLVQRYGIMSALVAPIVYKDKAIGALGFAECHTRRAFTGSEKRMALALAHQSAIAIENARLYECSRDQARDLALLNEVGQLLASTLEEETIFQEITRRCVEVFEVDSCLLRLVEDHRLVVKESYFLDPQDRQTVLDLLEEVPLNVGEGIAGRVAQTGEAAVSGEEPVETLTDSPYAEYLRHRHWLVVPMKSKGKVIGVLTLMTGELGRPFTSRDCSLAQGIANQAAVAIENAQLYRQVQVSEQEYRTLVENATELIWTLDAEGRFTFFNHVAEQVSGHKLEDWLGKSFAPLIAPPEDLPRLQQIFLETLSGKAQSYEVGVYRNDGTV